MKALKYSLCAIGLTLVNYSAFAVDKTKLDASKPVSLSKIQKKYKNTGSLEADFTQEVYQASLARTKTSTGNFKLSKPNLVRWEIYEPESSLMVSNGRKLYYFNPDALGKGKGQVIERKGSELEKQPIFQILSGTSRLDQRFAIEKKEENNGLTKEAKSTSLRLKPKSPMGDVSGLVLKVTRSHQIEEILIEHESGNKTKITLQNQVLGAKLPAELFDFKPPADAEILKN
jgi:outer membrane lipoprotein carrier protein